MVFRKKKAKHDVQIENPDHMLDDDGDYGGRPYMGENLEPLLTADEVRSRVFASGATRDTEEGKPDFSGFLSWEVISRFGEYMHEHRHQADGTLRDADNWKKGMPRDVYIASLFRHFIQLWALHDETEKSDTTYETENELEEALCAILFNAQGYLYERLNGR